MCIQDPLILLSRISIITIHIRYHTFTSCQIKCRRVCLTYSNEKSFSTDAGIQYAGPSIGIDTEVAEIHSLLTTNAARSP